MEGSRGEDMGARAPSRVIPLSEYVRSNFDIWHGDDKILDLVEGELLHFVLVYGISRQGKSVLFRNLWKYYTRAAATSSVPSALFYIKQTLEPGDVDVLRASDENKAYMGEFNDKVYDGIMRVLSDKKAALAARMRGRMTKAQRNVLDTRVVLFWDDFQGCFGDNYVLKKKLDALLDLLAKQGRHYNIVSYVGAQSYKAIKKDIRSQASLFLTFYPVDREYRENIWREFFKFGKFDDFGSMNLPRYSILGMIKAEDRAFVLLRN